MILALMDIKNLSIVDFVNVILVTLERAVIVYAWEEGLVDQMGFAYVIHYQVGVVLCVRYLAALE